MDEVIETIKLSRPVEWMGQEIAQIQLREVDYGVLCDIEDERLGEGAKGVAVAAAMGRVDRQAIRGLSPKDGSKVLTTVQDWYQKNV